MKIVNRFLLNGNKNGYTVENDGIELNVTELGLYEAETLEGLCKEGYKIVGYYGNIITPEGISIKDLEPVPFTGNEAEKQFMYDMEEAALSESEASIYFSREVDVKEIELLQSTNEIKTREELISYLKKWKKLSEIKSVVRDVRPLNSFVSREALFTLEEFIQNDIIRLYFYVIKERRILRSEEELKQLIKFLQDTASLKEDPTADDIKTAYLKWGVCGFSTAITSIHTEPNISVGIFKKGFVSEPDNPKDIERTVDLCILEPNGALHYSGGIANFMEEDEMRENGDVVFMKAGEYDAVLRKRNSWGSKYAAIMCQVKDSKQRTFISMMSSAGVTYMAKVDNHRIVIESGGNTVYSDNFLIVSTMDGSKVKLSVALKRNGLAMYTLARAKARELINRRTVPVPVKSTMSLLIEEGLSPNTAINYIASQVMLHPVDNDILASPGVRLNLAERTYRLGISPALIKKYNPEDEEYSTWSELVSIMLNTRDNLISEERYLEDDGSLSTKREIEERPLEQLEFVKNVLTEDMCIGELGKGIRADKNSHLNEVTNFLLALIELEKGKKLELFEFKQVLASIEDQNLFNLESVIRKHEEAYKGYFRDRARVNRLRAVQSAAMVYITKVFREISNLDISEQRHYAFECIKIERKKNGGISSWLEIIGDAILRAVDSGNFSVFEREIVKVEAPSFAARIAFKIYLDQAKAVVSGQEVIIEERLIHTSEERLQIRIPLALYNTILNSKEFETGKVASLHDWCNAEWAGADSFGLYCVNAAITPWKVSPTKGSTIPEYAFAINFIEERVLSKLSEKFINRVKEENAKVMSLSSQYAIRSLFGYESGQMPSRYKDTMGEYVDMDDVLFEELSSDELFVDYYDRFDQKKRKFADCTPPMYLKRMRLKSDITFARYAEQFSPYPMSDDKDEYEELVDKKCQMKWLTTTTPALLNGNKEVLRIEQKGNVVSDFEIKSEKFEDILTWNALVTGEFKQKGVCTVCGSSLILVNKEGHETHNLKDMRQVEFERLVADGIVYPLGARLYLIKATNGDFKVEVVNA